ncbi:hypothetical protein BB561_005192 [Smittium simulii]|uniref:DNA helicase n=1 Tax=Smittium simulii TaxID=133385 RepID=A0A2T9YBK9_9FUNG|nr:hypothetical protein BB561_005192 [Smittium simulii]
MDSDLDSDLEIDESIIDLVEKLEMQALNNAAVNIDPERSFSSSMTLAPKNIHEISPLNSNFLISKHDVCNTKTNNIASEEAKNKSNESIIDYISIDSDFSDSELQHIDWDAIEINTDTKKEYNDFKQEIKPHLNTLNTSSPFIESNNSLSIPNITNQCALEENHEYNNENLLTYLYPVVEGQQIRSYQQLAIIKSLKENSLISLPTGLGKTYIATVVMANYARWFPDGICIFLAPSRPLVTQQAKACAPALWVIANQNTPSSEELKSQKMESEMNLSNEQLFSSGYKFNLNGKEISTSLICEMNGTLKPSIRKEAWETAKFVFATPQTVQNDLKTGVLSKDIIQRITMLIVDEAHRTRGGYAFGVCMDELIKHQLSYNNVDKSYDPNVNGYAEKPTKGQFRVIALTATPGSDVKSVQTIIDRLHLSYGFFRTESSMDVAQYLHGRKMVERVVKLPPWHTEIVDMLAGLTKKFFSKLSSDYSVLPMPNDVKSVVPYYVLMHTQRWSSFNSSNQSKKSLVAAVWDLALLLTRLLQVLQLLQTQGFSASYRILNQMSDEVNLSNQRGQSSTGAKLDCVSSPEFKKVLQACSYVLKRVGSNQHEFDNKEPIKQCSVNLPTELIYSHPKLGALCEIIMKHFEDNGKDTRIIVFTHFRDSVDEIIAVIKTLEPTAKPVGFVGQGKNIQNGTDTGDEYGNPEYNNTLGYSDNLNSGVLFNQGTLGNRKSSNQSFKNRTKNNQRGGFERTTRVSGNMANNSIKSTYNLSNSVSTSNNSVNDLEQNDEKLTVGKTGQNQKEQQRVLGAFSSGIFNVLVATCVAEEGLDICEVDLVVHYDAPKSPIQLLQRTGRTGRSRKGSAIVLLTNGTTEQQKYKQAISKYNSIQAQMCKPGVLKWHSDLSAKMMPDYFDIKDQNCSKAELRDWPRCVFLNISKDDMSIGKKLSQQNLLSRADIKKNFSKQEAEKKTAVKEAKILQKQQIKEQNLLKNQKKAKKIVDPKMDIDLNFDDISSSFDSNIDEKCYNTNNEPIDRISAMSKLIMNRKKTLDYAKIVEAKDVSNIITIKKSVNLELGAMVIPDSPKKVNAAESTNAFDFDSNKYDFYLLKTSKDLGIDIGSTDIIKNILVDNDEIYSNPKNELRVNESDNKPTILLKNKNLTPDYTNQDESNVLNSNEFLKKSNHYSTLETLSSNTKSPKNLHVDNSVKLVYVADTTARESNHESNLLKKDIDHENIDLAFVNTAKKANFGDFCSFSLFISSDSSNQQSPVKGYNYIPTPTIVLETPLENNCKLITEPSPLAIKNVVTNVLTSTQNSPSSIRRLNLKQNVSNPINTKLDDNKNNRKAKNIIESLVAIKNFNLPNSNPKKPTLKRKKEKKNKPAKSKGCKFVDDEAFLGDDSFDSQDDEFSAKRTAEKHANNESSDESGESQEGELNDGFIVSDSQIVFNSSQSVHKSQGTFKTPEKSHKFFSNSTFSNLDGKASFYSNEENINVNKGQNPEQEKVTRKGEQYDNYSFYRQAYNNQLTPASQIQREVKEWENRFMNRNCSSPTENRAQNTKKATNNKIWSLNGDFNLHSRNVKVDDLKVADKSKKGSLKENIAISEYEDKSECYDFSTSQSYFSSQVLYSGDEFDNLLDNEFKNKSHSVLQKDANEAQSKGNRVNIQSGRKRLQRGVKNDD